MRDDLTHPARFRRGRLALLVSGSYLALVLVAWLYFVYDSLFVDHPDASFAALPAVVLTAPLSLTVGGLVLSVAGLVPFLSEALLLGYGLLIAWGGWRLLRGPRLAAVA